MPIFQELYPIKIVRQIIPLNWSCLLDDFSSEDDLFLDKYEMKSRLLRMNTILREQWISIGCIAFKLNVGRYLDANNFSIYGKYKPIHTSAKCKKSSKLDEETLVTSHSRTQQSSKWKFIFQPFEINVILGKGNLIVLSVDCDGKSIIEKVETFNWIGEMK